MSADVGTLIILSLFGVSIVATYLAVRRNWLRIANASVVGGSLNIILVTVYVTSQGVSLPQAITIGLALGLLFTLMSVSIGAYFLAQSSGAAKEQSGK